MKRLLIATLILAIGCSFSAFAEEDAHAKKIIEMVKDGKLGKYDGHDGLLRTPKVTDNISSDDVLEYTSGSGVRVPELATVTITTNIYTITTADFGKMILVNTNVAVTITLATNATQAGAWVDVAVAVTASDACAPTIAAPIADTLVGPNDLDLDSVTFATGNRIGAYARFIAGGTAWRVLNLGGTTMTYTD